MRQVRQLCRDEYLRGSNERSIGQSSIDLHLSDQAYELTGGSIKPDGQDRYLLGIREAGLVKRLSPDEDGSFTLEPKRTYLFKTQETLHASAFANSTIYGQATAKSSVGRLDVLARLIVDGMDGYEGFSPFHAGKGNGDMFLEITPITFRVKVKKGVPISQLRFFCGRPEDVEVRGADVYRTLLKDASREDGTLSVDLSDVEVGGVPVAAFRADVNSENPHDPIPLWVTSNLPDPCAYWKFERADSHKRLKIAKGAFYILRSKEKIAVPRGIAVYCRAIDETIGEIRIHYAGFVHPFFGRDKDSGRLNTPLIFEVRGHDIDVNLRDGEKLARLAFYRMSEDAEYNPDEPQDYNDQRLKLSKFFAAWPSRLNLHPDTHTVSPAIDPTR